MLWVIVPSGRTADSYLWMIGLRFQTLFSRALCSQLTNSFLSKSPRALFFSFFSVVISLIDKLLLIAFLLRTNVGMEITCIKDNASIFVMWALAILALMGINTIHSHFLFTKILFSRCVGYFAATGLCCAWKCTISREPYQMLLMTKICFADKDYFISIQWGFFGKVWHVKVCNFQVYRKTGAVISSKNASGCFRDI